MLEGLLVVALLAPAGLVAAWTLRARRAPRKGRDEGGAAKAERRLEALLDAVGVEHARSPDICGFRPAFYVPRWDLVVEYWDAEPADSPRRAERLEAYRRAGHKVASLDADDWWELEEALLARLARWDPSVVPRWRAAQGRLRPAR